MKKNLRALIFGASNGVGKMLSFELVRKGINVTLVSRKKYKLRKMVNELNKIKKGNKFYSIDLLKDNNPRKISLKIKKDLGFHKFIVHCVGGGLGVKSIVSSKKEWLKVWNFNAGICIEANSVFIPKMEKKKQGKIICISSMSTKFSNVQHDKIPYIASKAYLNSYIVNTAKFLKKRNVELFGILPGPMLVKGKYWEKLFLENKIKVNKYLKKNFNMKTLISVERVVKKILSIIFEKKQYSSGSLILMK
jgi:short-subunit dehydrogenase